MNTPQSIIPQSDDRLLSYFLKETIVRLFSGGSGDLNNRNKKDDMLIFIVLGLILIVATEPLKVLLRRNIGKLSISMPRLVVACILYLIWAVIIFAIIADGKFQQFRIGLLAGVVFYFLLSLFILILGVKEYSVAKMRYNQNKSEILQHLYRGDSVFFVNRINKSKGQDLTKIWLKTEPSFCFWTGLLLTIVPAFIHPIFLMLGAPLLVSSLSFWFNEWFQINNVWDVQFKKILREMQKNTQQQHYNSNDGFSPVS